MGVQRPQASKADVVQSMSMVPAHKSCIKLNPLFLAAQDRSFEVMSLTSCQQEFRNWCFSTMILSEECAASPLTWQPPPAGSEPQLQIAAWPRARFPTAKESSEAKIWCTQPHVLSTAIHVSKCTVQTKARPEFPTEFILSVILNNPRAIWGRQE